MAFYIQRRGGDIYKSGRSDLGWGYNTIDASHNTVAHFGDSGRSIPGGGAFSSYEVNSGNSFQGGSLSFLDRKPFGGFEYFFSGGIENGKRYNQDGVFLGFSPYGGSSELLSAISGISAAGVIKGSLLAFEAGAAKGGTNLVYQGFDKAGAIKYVGITSRDAAVRFGEHLGSGTGKALLRYEVVPGATNLSRTGARVWEQTLINKHGLDNLLNIRNSIAPKYWWQYGIK